jgi:hypothetical protein
MTAELELLTGNIGLAGLRHMIVSYSSHMNGFPLSYRLVSPSSYQGTLI